MNDSPLLSIENVCAGYGPIQALENVSLEVYPGEIVTLIGANGAGKSTLLMSIYSQPPIQSGRIVYQSVPIHTLPTHTIASRGITISPERRRIFPKMTTEDNLLMGALKGQEKKTIERYLDINFERFPILKERRTQRAGTLSGGEQQMLAMARALMSAPTLFLLDEPSLGLAPKIVEQIFTTLKDIAQTGTTILLVEQNAYHALKLANRGYVLVNGQIQLSGTGEELLKNPDIQGAYLGKIE